jgi:hypothetical protein
VAGARIATVAFALLAAAVLAACAENTAPPGVSAPQSDARGSAGAPPAVPAGRTAVLAPIDAVELVVRESQPPRYALRITAGLPSGCARFERVDVTRDGAIVNVSVWNTLPADAAVACTMIYGTTEHTAELGSDFQNGEAYAVHVNGERRLGFTPE